MQIDRKVCRLNTVACKLPRNSRVYQRNAGRCLCCNNLKSGLQLASELRQTWCAHVSPGYIDCRMQNLRRVLNYKLIRSAPEPRQSRNPRPLKLQVRVACAGLVTKLFKNRSKLIEVWPVIITRPLYMPS